MRTPQCHWDWNSNSLLIPRRSPCVYLLYKVNMLQQYRKVSFSGGTLVFVVHYPTHTVINLHTQQFCWYWGLVSAVSSFQLRSVRFCNLSLLPDTHTGILLSVHCVCARACVHARVCATTSRVSQFGGKIYVCYCIAKHFFGCVRNCPDSTFTLCRPHRPRPDGMRSRRRPSFPRLLQGSPAFGRRHHQHATPPTAEADGHLQTPKER